MRAVVGCMTGTSLDALDAALVTVEGEGLAMRGGLRRSTRRPLGPLAERLRPVADQRPVSAGEVATLCRDVGRLHADAVADLLDGEAPDLVAVHGQTVFHRPPVTFQLADPHVLAATLRCPVVSDLRRADVAAGGEGAPITPLADHVLFAHPTRRRVVVNLGGFANLTWLPPRGVDATAGIHGGDVCACNHLLDGLARRLLQVPCDPGGRHAGGGVRLEGPYRRLAARLVEQATAGRSLGTGDEEIDGWLVDDATSFADAAATACEAIAEAVGRATRAADEVILAGGGVNNAALVGAIRARVEAPVQRSDTLGVPADDREAVAMAVLGALSADRVPITLPAVTGASRPPVAGSWVFP